VKTRVHHGQHTAATSSPSLTITICRWICASPDVHFRMFTRKNIQSISVESPSPASKNGSLTDNSFFHLRPTSSQMLLENSPGRGSQHHHSIQSCILRSPIQTEGKKKGTKNVSQLLQLGKPLQQETPKCPSSLIPSHINAITFKLYLPISHREKKIFNCATWVFNNKTPVSSSLVVPSQQF
jgi:hypothetical protein